MSEWFEQVKRGLSRAADEAERLTRIGRLRLEISNLQRRRARALREAGETVYQMVEAGTLAAPAPVETYLAQARDAEREVALREAEIEALRARAGEASRAETAAPVGARESTDNHAGG